jgi:hypothetical protein
MPEVQQVAEKIDYYSPEYQKQIKASLLKMAADISKSAGNGVPVPEADLDKEIKSEKDFVAKFSETGKVKGAVGVEITVAERDRKIAALDGFFFGEAQKVGEELVPPYPRTAPSKRRTRRSPATGNSPACCGKPSTSGTSLRPCL